jgi:hypothetical protein
MEITVTLEGQAVNEKAILAVQDWIRVERIPGAQVTRLSPPPKEGELGASFQPVLYVGLQTAKAVVRLAKSLHSFFLATRPKYKIKVEFGPKDRRVSFELVAEQLADLNALIAHVTSLIQDLGGNDVAARASATAQQHEQPTKATGSESAVASPSKPKTKKPGGRPTTPTSESREQTQTEPPDSEETEGPSSKPKAKKSPRKRTKKP